MDPQLRARIVANCFRFGLFAHDGEQYTEIAPDHVDHAVPVLLKPPRPESSYIASDADYVDYITELMGGFAISAFFKTRGRDKRYRLLGLRLNRDIERMMLLDLIYDAASSTGWALIEGATASIDAHEND